MTVSTAAITKVLIEMSDGRVYDISGYTTSLIWKQSGYDGLYELEISLVGDPAAIQPMMSKRWLTKIEAMRTSLEWMCSRCAAPNTREDRQCTQCGASRSFLYDL